MPRERSDVRELVVEDVVELRDPALVALHDVRCCDKGESVTYNVVACEILVLWRVRTRCGTALDGVVRTHDSRVDEQPHTVCNEFWE